MKKLSPHFLVLFEKSPAFIDNIFMFRTSKILIYSINSNKSGALIKMDFGMKYRNSPNIE